MHFVEACIINNGMVYFVSNHDLTIFSSLLCLCNDDSKDVLNDFIVCKSMIKVSYNGTLGFATNL